MKRYMQACLVLLIAVFFPGRVFSVGVSKRLETATDKKLLNKAVQKVDKILQEKDNVVWETKILDDKSFPNDMTERLSFSKVHTWNNCWIYEAQLNPDGLKLWIYVEVDQTLSYVTRISLREGKRVIRHTVFESETTDDGKITSITAGDSKDGIFKKKCLFAAQHLPPEVKKLFFGYYGLGERPFN